MTPPHEHAFTGAQPTMQEMNVSLDHNLSAPIVLEVDGTIARLRFNRPEQLNAIDVPTARAFHEACQRIANSDGLRAVVISGNGRAFVAGGDLRALCQDPVVTASAVIDPMNRALLILKALSQPVIASLHGHVAGAGIGIALACDFAIAAEATQFNLAYARIGASLDCSASWHLVRAVGLRKAIELSVLSPTFDAREALAFGIVGNVVAAEELEAATSGLAARLAKGPTVAFGAIKRQLNSAHAHTLEEHLALEQAAFCECAATADFSNGVEAFLAGAKPVFQGR